MDKRIFVKYYCPYCEFVHDVLIISFLGENQYQEIVFQCMADGFEFEVKVNTRRHKKFIPPKEFFK